MCYSNSLYGKLIENGLNRMDCKFVTDEETAMMHNTNPRLKGRCILDPNFSVSFLRKTKTDLNQLWAVGFSILEISKYIMQSLYYNGLKPAFNNRITTLFSDTDSLCMLLPARSIDAAMRRIKPLMDFSNYPRDHPLFDESKKFRPGFLKNETPGQDITEVVGVRSKVYAFRLKDGGITRRCKGVKKSVRNRIPFDAFKDCVMKLCKKESTQYSIQSKKHQNKLIRVTKVSMTSFDDKRYLMCGKHSVPYGSRLIREYLEKKHCPLCADPKLFI